MTNIEKVEKLKKEYMDLNSKRNELKNQADQIAKALNDINVLMLKYEGAIEVLTEPTTDEETTCNS